MSDLLGRIKHYGGIFGRGLLLEAVPGMAAGAINGLFHQWNVDVDTITEYVQNNRSLLEEMSPETKNQLAFAAQKVGNLDFITPIFFLNSIKKDFPEVAALFLRWPEAAEWLAKQIDELKAGVNGTDLESH